VRPYGTGFLCDLVRYLGHLIHSSSYDVSSRFERVKTSVSSRACSNIADDEEAVVLACTTLVFCALGLHKSQEQLLEKVDMSTPVQAVAVWRRP